MFSKRSSTVRIVFLIHILFRVYVECRSGWFIDDGVGQTILDEYLPRADTQELQHMVLDLLGLPNQPHLDRFSSTIRKSVPKFLLRIYEQLSEKDDLMNGENSNEDGMFLKPRRRRSLDDNDGITDENARIIDESDFIMTFLNNRNALSALGHNDNNGTRLSFDLSEVSPNATELLMSELHLYKRRSPENHLKSHLCIITLHAINVVDGMKALRPIYILNTTVNYEGWIRINFTTTLNEWLIKSWSHNLLFISIDYENENGELETSSIDTNYLLSFWDDEHQPFVTAYFKSENILKPIISKTKLHRRSKREVQPTRSKIRRHRSVSISINPLFDKNLHAAPAQPCQRYALYVSFKDLQWEWIIAPEGYGAFYCAGQCGFPSPNNVSYTNHAILQTLAHLMQSPKIPKPCCAPTKLGAISVLYIPKETSVHLRKYPKMVAKNCGCQ